MSGPIRILLVDDEQPILRSLARLLAFESWAVSSVENAADALTLLRGGDIAVIISDFHLGNVGGVELLREARQISPDTSRILFSGHIDLDLLRRAVNGGEIYRFVPKPWDDDELLQAVRQGVDRWQLLQHNRALIARAQEQNRHWGSATLNLERMVGERTAMLEMRNQDLALSQEVLDQLPVAVVGIAADGRVMLANRVARGMFPDLVPGAPPSSGSGDTVWEWSRAALDNGTGLVVDGSLGPLRIEVMALGGSGVVLTVIPLGTTPGSPPGGTLGAGQISHGSAT